MSNPLLQHYEHRSSDDALLDSVSMSGRFSDPLECLVVPIIFRAYAGILKDDDKRLESHPAQMDEGRYPSLTRLGLS